MIEQDKKKIEFVFVSLNFCVLENGYNVPDTQRNQQTGIGSKYLATDQTDPWQGIYNL